jgi:hypothetical protein
MSVVPVVEFSDDPAADGESEGTADGKVDDE